MPAQHGQTYDPDEEPTPRGGWFACVERPFPERLDRAFRVLAIVVAAVVATGTAWIVLVGSGRPLRDLSDYGWAAVAVVLFGALAYGAIRAVGMILVGIYGTARHGSEFVVDWRAVRHDLPLRRTWIVILEGALLLAAAGISVWGLILFIREGLLFGLAVLVVVQTMTYWPMIRRRIAARQTGQ